MGACMSLCEKLSLFPKKNQEAHKQGGVYLDESFNKKDKQHRLRVGLLSKDEESDRKKSISIELQSRRVMEEKEREIEEYNQEQEAIQQMLPNNVNVRQQQLTRYSKKREAQQLQNELIVQRDSGRIKKEKEKQNEIVPQQKEQDKYAVQNNSQVVQGQKQEDQRQQICADKEGIAKGKTDREEQELQSSFIKPTQSPMQQTTLGQEIQEKNQQFLEEIKEKPVFNSKVSGNLPMQLDRISESRQQEQTVTTSAIVLDRNFQSLGDETSQINTKDHKDGVLIPIVSQNIKLTDEDSSKIATQNDHLLSLSEKVKDIMSGSEQDDLRTCAHTGQRNTAKGSYDEEINQETEGHHLSSQNIDENEEDEENEEKIRAKEEKIKEIRLSLQQQLNVIKPINSQLPLSNFSYHSKSHQHPQPMSQPSYAQSSYQSHKEQYPFQQQQQYQQQQQQQQTHGLGHAHSVSQNLNILTDETDFSLLLNNDSQKNSIIYGNFHPNAFRDSKFILDESIIHPVRDVINNGEDSDTSSKKEEWISDQIRKQQSTQDLVSLLQPARTSLESMNKFDKQSKDNYINFSENFYFSRQKAESEKAKADSIESISYSDKRASPINSNTITQTPKARIEEQFVRQQEERFSPQKMVVVNQGKIQGGSQDDLLPVKEEEDSRILPTKTDEFSFCFDDAANNIEEQDIDKFLKKNSKIFSAMHQGWSNQEEPVVCAMQQSEIPKNQQRISALSQPQQKNSNFEFDQKKRCQSENEPGINEKELDRLRPLPDFGGDHKMSNNEKKVGNIEDNRNVNDKKIEVVEISTSEAANQSNANSNQNNSLTYSPILPLELSFPQNNPGNLPKELPISPATSELQYIQNVQKKEFSNQKSAQNNDSSHKSDFIAPLADIIVKNIEKQESEIADNKNSQVNTCSEDSNKQNTENPINQKNNLENLSNTEQINSGNNDKNNNNGKTPNDINSDTSVNPEDMAQNKNNICAPNSNNPVPTKEESIDTKPNEIHLLPVNPSYVESPLVLEASSDHPDNISIVIQDPKNNTTEQLIYTIHPFNSKISLQRISVKETQSPEGSEKSQQPKSHPKDPTKALQFHKSLLENTNRIVMQKRRTPSITSQIPRNSSKQVLSQSNLEESSNTKVEKVLENGRNIDEQMSYPKELNVNFGETKTPHEEGEDEEEKKQSRNEQGSKRDKLKDAKKEESTLEQNSKLLEEEWKSARGNFSQIDENTQFYSALSDLHGKSYISQDTSPANQQMNNGSRTSLGQGNTQNFANGVFEESKTFDDLNVSDGKNMCKSDSFKSCRDEQNNSSQNISPTRMGRSASVNFFKAGVVQMKNSTESPFESCFHTPSGSVRGSLKILTNDLYQRRSIQNMQQVSYFKKSSVASQQYFDCDSYQVQVIDSDKLVNRDLVEHPETYMEWIQTLSVLFEIPAVLSSEALYQFELIKQETYQDFVVKLQSENTDNFDLFDVIIDGENRTIFFRSELGLDQQRVFIVIGEYYVKTHSYAAFYNFKNSFDAQHRLNAFDTLSPLNDDLQNTILVGVSTHRLLPKPCEFLFLKHFSFLQQTNGVEDEDNNSNNQAPPIEQMCEIDISLNSEEIEQHLKANRKSIPQNSQVRGELFSGNIATTIQNENQIKVEILFEQNFHNALTVQQARHMYTEMFTQFFEKLDATFP